MKRLTGIASILLIVAFGALACGPGDLHLCEEYCNEMVDCAETLGQLESRSACERDCFDWLERYETVGCDERFLDLQECEIGLSCTTSYDVGKVCSSEIQRLNSCLE